MGRLADDNLPEVVTDPSHGSRPPTAVDSTPEVVSSEDAAGHYYVSEREKYPAQYDDTPKLPVPYEGLPEPGWRAAEPVSALTPSAASVMPWESLPAAEESNTNVKGGDADQEKQICGIPRRVFIIIAIVLLVVVIAAGVGGGVGGAIANRSNNPPPQEASSSSSSSTTTTTSTSTTSTSSTTTAAQPTQTVQFLNNQTGLVGFGFQGFSRTNYLGKNTSIIRTEGFHDLNISINSYVWLPERIEWPICCVTFCANKKTAVGWRCDPRYQPEASSPASRVYIWCDREHAGLHNETCS